MGKKQIGILGATGYTGLELLKLLEVHPNFEVDFVTSERYVGSTLQEMFPFLAGRKTGALQFIPLSEALTRNVSGVFSCLPHKTAAEKIIPFIDKGEAVVVDLSADFRMRNPEIYERHYCKHPKPDLCQSATYGLSEHYETEISKSKLIGNPGCYPTSILIPLIPLIKKDLIEPNGIISDSKSGVSGAGKTPSPVTHFVETNESFAAYAIGDEHRHLSEINEQLSLFAKQNVSVLFTPHLVPMTRGILSTIYVTPKTGVSKESILQTLSAAYEKESMVEFLAESLPKTSFVSGTNRCMFGMKWANNGKNLILVSVIDNLIKGASGQALQNMNIALGLPGNKGLL
jgi:N-acetyl-gamma-glutamyl-phosphate reductase